MEYSIIINNNFNYWLLFYSAAHKLLNEKLDLPSFIKVNLSNRTQKMINLLTFKEENEDVEKYNADDNIKTIIKENRTNETKFGLVFNNKLVFC